MCGEKDPVFPGLLLHLGSPPRVRGKEFWGCCCAGCHRITPACAGKSCNLSGVLCQFRDHPRVCGEKNSIFCPVFSVTGSPPRVRGKAPRPSPSRPSRRITPACAGKRPRFLWQPGRLWDHPRVCGEKPRFCGQADLVRGSPPRVRGKGWRTVAEALMIGITPACAGKRLDYKIVGFGLWDHPRVCGEKT